MYDFNLIPLINSGNKKKPKPALAVTKGQDNDARPQNPNHYPAKLKDFGQKKAVPKEKPPHFLRLAKDCELLKPLSNRQKQVYLCLLWLSSGGKNPVCIKYIREFAQKKLGIKKRTFFKHIKNLEKQKLIVNQKTILWNSKENRPFSKFCCYVNSSALNREKFLYVPIFDELFEKGFDIECYLNALHKKDRYPLANSRGQGELFAINKRTARRRRSKTWSNINHLEQADKKRTPYKRTTVIPPHHPSKSGYQGKLFICGKPVDWFKCKKEPAYDRYFLFYKGRVYKKSQIKYHYEPIQGKETLFERKTGRQLSPEKPKDRIILKKFQALNSQNQLKEFEKKKKLLLKQLADFDGKLTPTKKNKKSALLFLKKLEKRKDFLSKSKAGFF